MLDGLNKQFDVLTSQGARLVLLTVPCARSVLWALSPDAAEREQDTFRRVAALNGLYRQFAERHPDKVTLVDLNGFACPEGKFTDLVINGVKMREDGVHFTANSSYIVARWLAPQIAAAAAQSRP